MMLINALKTVCDFLLYFTFASLFGAYMDAWLLMGVVLLLAFLSSLILQKSKGTLPAKILCGLLPALGLFAAQDLAQILITVVAIAFYCVLIIAGKNEIHYEDYKAWFALPAVPVITVFVICFGQWPIRPAATVCAALYLFLGVLVLRGKRIGYNANIKLRLMNFGSLAGALGLGILACVLLYVILSHSGKILEYVMMPIGLLFNGLAYVLTLFGNWLVRHQPEETAATTEAETTTAPAVPNNGGALPKPGEDDIYVTATMIIRILFILLVIAVIIYLLYRFYLMLRRVKKEETEGADEIEEGESEQFFFRRSRWKKKKKTAAPSNNEKIRRIYREYLYCVKAYGAEIDRQSTSQDVLEASDSLMALDGSERLRELYIRARYHDSEEMSDAEVEEAETLQRNIREQLAAEKARSSAAGKTGE